jgi:hypothetical protein
MSVLPAFLGAKQIPPGHEDTKVRVGDFAPNEWPLINDNMLV